MHDLRRRVPVRRLVKGSRRKDGCEPMCLTCDGKRKRRAEHGFDLGHLAVYMAPCPRPAVRLRISLERSRALGVPWDDAWPEGVEAALRQETKHHRVEWLEVFRATSHEWHSAYVREPGSGPGFFIPE